MRAFERENFEVATAGSLKEAYEVAGEFAPDFAVVDLNLQDGYGMELVGALQDLRPGVRVVVLTGYDSIASSLVALKAGAVGYLAKPVQPEQVVQALVGEPDSQAEPAERPMSADRVRWEHIQRVFEQCNRNVSETARRLNMHRRTLQRILSKRAPRPKSVSALSRVARPDGLGAAPMHLGVRAPQARAYWPRGGRASRSGALESFISPVNGPSSSYIRKTAAATDRTESRSAAITVGLRGANRPKLAKIAVSHAPGSPAAAREPCCRPARTARDASASARSSPRGPGP